MNTTIIGPNKSIIIDGIDFGNKDCTIVWKNHDQTNGYITLPKASDGHQWEFTNLTGDWTYYTTEVKERVIKKFMWAPRKFKGRFRWLCFTYIVQEQVLFPPENRYIWCDSKFLNYNEYLEWRIINE